VDSQVLASSDKASAAYQSKPDSYFAGARLDFVRLLPRDPSAAILEIGCGSGATGALALAGGRAGRYVGIELFERAANEARTVLTDVITGDVEKIDLPFGPTEFDALIMSEVLEHLVEPQATLEKLAKCLRPGAMVMASSPNISHWRVVRELMLGRFHLADQGVFDRTHLRWFTPETFAAMFTKAGFKVQVVAPVTPFAARTKLISKLTKGRFDHLFFEQIALVGVKR
jgi:2-polyprenyl-3-methyl-5-hydroxy-6-metoxy-1,4-benzoquinol methylase